jgi:hypothetical protein
MKQHILITSFILISVFNACGQVAFSIRGGLNLNGFSEKVSSSLTNDPGRSAFGSGGANNIGFHTGAALNLKITDSFSFQPEVGFSLRGAWQDDNRFNINYLDLPLLIAYNPVKKLTFQGGAVLSYRLWATGYSFPDQKRENYTDIVEPFSFGITGGIVYDLTNKISVYGNYYHGLLHTWEITYRNVNNSPAGTLEYFNRNISIGVYYKIIPHKKV